MTAPMTLRHLEWRLRVHGPALAAWPEEERVAALALLRRSAAARAHLAEVLARDEDGDQSCMPALHRMQARLCHAIAAREAPARLAIGARWGALAACALLGAWLGVALPASQKGGDPLQIATGLSFSTPLGSLQP